MIVKCINNHAPVFGLYPITIGKIYEIIENQDIRYKLLTTMAMLAIF